MTPRDPIPAQAFIAEARALVGTRFVDQGRNAAGVDCIGFLHLTTVRVGLDIQRLRKTPKFSAYGRNANPRLLEILRTYGADLEIPAPIPACAILFRFTGVPDPQHFAIYTDAGTMIHADARRGRVVECSYRAAWRRFTHSYWLFPGIDYAN